jgi:cytidine deaminase
MGTLKNEDIMIKKLCLLSFLLLSTLTYGAVELSVQKQQELFQHAQEARKKAYAPYSKFYVGAALLTVDGKIITGCNVENASYGMTNCAERTAVFKAVSDGYQDYVALAVAVPGGGTPCGSCRQVLNEFNPDMLIIYNDEKGQLQRATVSQMLPHAFGPHNLE